MLRLTPGALLRPFLGAFGGGSSPGKGMWRPLWWDEVYSGALDFARNRGLRGLGFGRTSLPPAPADAAEPKDKVRSRPGRVATSEFGNAAPQCRRHRFSLGQGPKPAPDVVARLRRVKCVRDLNAVAPLPDIHKALRARARAAALRRRRALLPPLGSSGALVLRRGERRGRLLPLCLGGLHAGVPCGPRTEQLRGRLRRRCEAEAMRARRAAEARKVARHGRVGLAPKEVVAGCVCLGLSGCVQNTMNWSTVVWERISRQFWGCGSLFQYCWPTWCDVVARGSRNQFRRAPLRTLRALVRTFASIGYCVLKDRSWRTLRVCPQAT